MIHFPDKKYNVIYADPPWKFGDRFWSAKKLESGKNVQVSLNTHYETMSLQDICNLPVPSICFDDCVLFLWTTDAHIPDAISVIESWDFFYKKVGFVWNKKTVNFKQVCYMGRWTMKESEICLLATKGHPHKLLKVRNVRQLVEAKRRDHSQKPIEVANIIKLMFGDVPCIELFAREIIEGWDAWGNEI